MGHGSPCPTPTSPCATPGRVLRHALIQDPKARTKCGNSYDEYLGWSRKVLPATKPAPDSFHARQSSKKKFCPKYEPKDVAIKYRGRTIVPVFNRQDGMFEYRGPGGATTQLAQEFYSPAEMRKAAIEGFSEDF